MPPSVSIHKLSSRSCSDSTEESLAISYSFLGREVSHPQDHSSRRSRTHLHLALSELSGLNRSMNGEVKRNISPPAGSPDSFRGFQPLSGYVGDHASPSCCRRSWRVFRPGGSNALQFVSLHRFDRNYGRRFLKLGKRVGGRNTATTVLSETRGLGLFSVVRGA